MLNSEFEQCNPVTSHGRRPRAKFSLDEDKQLQSLVEQLGANDWNLIAEAIEGRSPRQCRERWMNYLCPALNTTTWTEEEDLLLVQKFQELGGKWVAMARFFPNRTDSMIKNRFNRMRRRHAKQGRYLHQSEVGSPFAGAQNSCSLRAGPSEASIEPVLPARDEGGDYGDFTIWSDPFARAIDDGFDLSFDFM
jgi:hypothetical protein